MRAGFNYARMELEGKVYGVFATGSSVQLVRQAYRLRQAAVYSPTSVTGPTPLACNIIRQLWSECGGPPQDKEL